VGERQKSVKWETTTGEINMGKEAAKIGEGKIWKGDEEGFR